MRSHRFFLLFSGALAVLGLGGAAIISGARAPEARAAEPVVGARGAVSRAELPKTVAEGARFTLGGREVSVKRLDALPLVENEYSQVFTFDTFENPRLKELRARYELDKVVAEGKDEFDRQVRLMDWVFHRFKKFGTPTSQARGALAILQAVDEGHTFYCAHYEQVFVSAAASMGWIDRPIALKRADRGRGYSEHSITEIWSNQYRKWVMLDPTYAAYVEKDGVPLNAYEIRQEWFYNAGKGLTFVFGARRERFTKKDLPVVRGHFAGYGDLEFADYTLNCYAFLGYVPNTNLMDAGPDYARMFITKDKLCDAVTWHTRKNPNDPAHEPYFPVQQAALTLSPSSSGDLQVEMRTLTPNFQTFRVRTDGGRWADRGSSFAWALHPGSNRLEAQSVNKFGVEGPISTVELVVR